MAAPLVEGEDYQLEDGLLVFTAAYHLKRGYCCGAGCRRCPYDASFEASPTRRPGPGRRRASRTAP